MIESIDELHGVFAQLVRDASGVPLAILANQGGSRPVGAYATYNPMPIRAYGHPRRLRSDIPAAEPVPAFEWTDFDELTISNLELLLSLNFFNDGSQNAAMRMLNCQFRSPIGELLYFNGLSVRDAGPVRDLTRLEAAEIQSRHQVDVHMYAEVSISDTVLRAAGMKVKIEDEYGNILTAP